MTGGADEPPKARTHTCTLHLRVGPSTLTVTFKHRNPNPIEKISCFRTRISEKSAPVPSARVRAMDVLQSSKEAMIVHKKFNIDLSYGSYRFPNLLNVSISRAK